MAVRTGENRIPVAVLFATLVLLAAPTLAQDVIGSVTLETTAGTILIDLEEDHPGVRDHARAFANMVRDRVFFHRSDKTIACDADDPNCFPCTCVFPVNPPVNCLGEQEGTCLGDLNERTCTESTEFLVNDQLALSATLHAGLFELDPGNHLDKIEDVLDPALQNARGVFENNSMTVAFVRTDPLDPLDALLTSEWIINVQDNSEVRRSNGTTFDDEDGDGAAAHLVFGLVVAGQNVVNVLAGLPVTDARCDQDLMDDPRDDEEIRSELSQLPLVDFDVEPLPELVTFCMPSDDACLQPLCNEPSADGLTCDDPLCYSLIPLSDAEQDIIDEGGEVDRFCEFPEQPNFPLITKSTPAGLALVNNGLAPPEPENVVDYPNNPSLIVDVRNLGCPDDLSDPIGPCDVAGVPTFLEVVTGGSVDQLRVFDTSRGTVEDGRVEALELFDAARGRIAGGAVPSLTTTESSDVAVSGGTIGNWVARGASTGLVTGGGLTDIRAEGSSLLRIVGADFTGGGVSFGALTEASGTLRGTLAEGDPLDAAFAQGDLAGTATGVIYLLSTSDFTPTSGRVLIGNPGNPADQATGLGAVSYGFEIGQSEVTNAQYVQFLSAIAFSDPHGLYNTEMMDDPRGGIVRTGADGNYRYEATSGRADQPVVFVSYLDAIRYVNWLHNGRPAGVGDAATEDGTYDIAQCTTTCTRKPGARPYLPRADEWYKAAYYDPNGGAYFAYPTSSNTAPASEAPTRDVGNHANTDGALGNDQDPLSDAGAYRFSASPNGTLDQAGNVREWLEDSLDLRGGSWNTPVDEAESQSFTTVASNAVELDDVGFRVPEPSVRLLAAAALVTLASLRRRRRSVLSRDA